MSQFEKMIKDFPCLAKDILPLLNIPTIWDLYICLPVLGDKDLVLHPFRRVENFFENREYGFSTCYKFFQDITRSQILYKDLHNTD